jgi:hypothetical protein
VNDAAGECAGCNVGMALLLWGPPTGGHAHQRRFSWKNAINYGREIEAVRYFLERWFAGDVLVLAYPAKQSAAVEARVIPNGVEKSGWER